MKTNAAEFVSTIQSNAGIEQQIVKPIISPRKEYFANNRKECIEALKRDLYKKTGVLPYGNP